MTTPVSDKVFLGAGALLFAGACAWAFMQQGSLAKLDGKVNVPSSGAAYSPEELPAANISEALPWPAATSMSRGPNWVYDVFTPPVIYYNTETKQFTVTPPVPPDTKTEVVVVKEKPFGLTLVKVEQNLFPLQLVGYIGTGAEARGNFQNEQTGETIIGTTGKTIPSLDLEITAFKAEVKRDIVEGQPVIYTVATATVRNTKTGKVTELTNTKRLTESDPVVIVQAEGESQTHELAAGAKLVIGDYTYVIDSIQVSPPSVTVTKSGGELAEPKTETLVEAVAAPAAPVDGMPDEPAAPPTPVEGFFPGF